MTARFIPVLSFLAARVSPPPQDENSTLATFVLEILVNTLRGKIGPQDNARPVTDSTSCMQCSSRTLGLVYMLASSSAMMHLGSY
jgi:hypothetical protein